MAQHLKWSPCSFAQVCELLGARINRALQPPHRERLDPPLQILAGEPFHGLVAASELNDFEEG